MAFFREFLKKKNVNPDISVDEQDEAAVMWFLTQSRVQRAAIRFPSSFVSPDELPPEMAAELEFVAAFSCFIGSKPEQYELDARAFRHYFVPGFLNDANKQKQLAESVRPAFFTATRADLRTAASLDRFLDMQRLGMVRTA
jgi:hypothetical protein